MDGCFLSCPETLWVLRRSAAPVGRVVIYGSLRVRSRLRARRVAALRTTVARRRGTTPCAARLAVAAAEAAATKPAAATAAACLPAVAGRESAVHCRNDLLDGGCEIASAMSAEAPATVSALAALVPAGSTAIVVTVRRVSGVTVPARLSVRAGMSVVVPVATMRIRAAFVGRGIRDQIISALVLRDLKRTRCVAGSHRDIAQGQRVVIAFLDNEAVAAVGVLDVGSRNRGFTCVGGDTELRFGGNVAEACANGRVLTVEEELLARLGIEGNRNARCQEARVDGALTGQGDVHRVGDVDAVRLAAECRIDKVQRAGTVQSLTIAHEDVAAVVLNGHGAVHDVDVTELNSRTGINDDRSVLRHLERTRRENRRAFAGRAGGRRDVERAVITDREAGNSRRACSSGYSFCRGSGARPCNIDIMVSGRRSTRGPVLNIIKIAV